MCEDETTLLNQAAEHLHAWTTGDLRFDEHIRPIRYVFAPDGKLVAPMMVAMLQATETVVHVPVADESSMELLVSTCEFDEDGPEGSLADRWRIYHGDPPDVHWALMDIDLVRFHGMVIDGEAVQLPNPLATIEPALCGEINRSHADAIQAALDKYLDIEAEDPRMVGVDPMGIDIRAKFDVVRLPMDPMVSNPDEAAGAVRDLLGIQ
ncbi:MAG: DUF2470 domain-containing protein [Planctomycetota bacterium]|nr:DUF2470 domain-containing protein [Planctomycetota bacterium]